MFILTAEREIGSIKCSQKQRTNSAAG